MVASAPFLVLALWGLQNVYLRTSRQLRLLDLESKSPLFSHFLESVSGLSTIRAFGWESRFRTRNERLVDQSQRPQYLLYCSQRWLNLVLDLIAGAQAVLVISLAVSFRHSTNPGLLGVSLNSILCKY
jgi:ATP-binding cassette subfamily C (CFTR/MRP) protein 1